MIQIHNRVQKQLRQDAGKLANCDLIQLHLLKEKGLHAQRKAQKMAEADKKMGSKLSDLLGSKTIDQESLIQMNMAEESQ